ncbi:MAG: hypothetical protein QGG09_16460, partial [Pirellulaceae bacterium]|nr:hypothetical protein [Pirellulaceae bacterium]
MSIACSAVTGACVVGTTYANLGNYARAIDFVEGDLADRLRSLRATTKHLRRWINAWLAIVVATLLTMWIGFDALVFALCAALLMCAGPWYVVRRLSEARRQKIEDQLADAMVMFSSAIRAGLSIPQSLELL